MQKHSRVHLFEVGEVNLALKQTRVLLALSRAGAVVGRSHATRAGGRNGLGVLNGSLGADTLLGGLLATRAGGLLGTDAGGVVLLAAGHCECGGLVVVVVVDGRVCLILIIIEASKASL